MENGSVSERIARMVEHFHKGNKSAFAKAVGISNQSLGEIVGARQSAPSFAALQKMLTAFPEVRMEWLVMGQGEMLRTTPVEWVDPFASSPDKKNTENSGFFPPSYLQEYTKRYQEQRDAEWAEYHKKEAQREADSVALRALLDHFAKEDKTGKLANIQSLLDSALTSNIDPDTWEKLADAEHERLSDEHHAQEAAEWRRQAQERQEPEGKQEGQQ